MRTTLFLLLTTAAAPALAQTSPPAGNRTSEDIIVTALRAPMERDRTAATITVLDEDALDRAQSPVVSDLLIRTPGVSLTRNGGYGTSTSIRIRGAEPEQTLLVVDGVRLADPSSTGGGYNFAHLMTGNAERIEILRGPQSILWGSQAIGGVVNIVTRAPDQPIEARFDVEAGSRETVSGRASLGGASGPVVWQIAGNSFSTDGISAISPRYGGAERDGYRNVGGSGHLGVSLADGLSATVRGYYSNSRTDIDSAGSAPDSPEYGLNEEWIGYAGLNADLFDGALSNRIAYSHSETERENIDPSRTVRQTSFAAKGRSQRYEYQGDLRIAKGWRATFGAEREEQRMRSASPGDNALPFATIHASADIDSVYGHLSGTPIPGLTLSGGVRHDHHSTFGGNTVFGGGGVLALWGGDTLLRASYGEGFKAPSLYQLFSDYGNTTLEPERAHGWEAGVEQHLLGRRVTLAATWFERTTTNLITYNGCPATNQPPLCFLPGTTTPRYGYYANIQRSKARGVEVAGSARFGGLSLDANYTFIEAEDRSPGPNFGNQLPRRPRHAANASATYSLPSGYSAGVAVRWSDKALDTVQSSAAAAPFVNAAYTLVDLRAEAPIGDGAVLFGRIENVFDEYYETARRFGTLGRSFYLGLRGRF